LRRASVDEVTLAAEVSACLNGDVPRFETFPSDLLVWENEYLPAGVRLSSDKHAPGLDSALALVADLNQPARVSFESEIIRNALGAAEASMAQVVSFGPDEPESDHSLESYRSAGAACLDRLQRFVHDQERYATRSRAWFGYLMGADRHFEYGPLGVDLYSGSAGILLALTQAAMAGSVSEGERHKTASRVTDNVRLDLKDPRIFVGGAYYGVLSALMPLAVAWDALGRPGAMHELEETAILNLRSAIDAPDPTRRFHGWDYFGGILGALAVGVAMFQRSRNSDWLPTLGRLVSLANEHAASEGDTSAWPQVDFLTAQRVYLTGLSHGQAGNALALAEFASLEAKESSVAANLARRAVLWELARFSPVHQNWPDLRTSAPSGNSGEYAWSHGAPGILLALTRIQSLMESPSLRGFLRNHPIPTFFSEQALASRARPVNGTLSSGALGLIGTLG